MEQMFEWFFLFYEIDFFIFLIYINFEVFRISIAET